MMLRRVPMLLWPKITRFAYANARVKAMKARLLSKQVMEQFMKAESVMDILGMLDRTPYKQDLSEPALHYAGAELIEFALGRHMARQARKVLSIIPQDAVGTIAAILEKWDIYNLKTILLGKHLGHTQEKIASLLVPAGSLTPAELKRLNEQKDVEELTRFVGRTYYGKVLVPLLEDYKKTRNIQPMLNALEKEYFTRLPERMGRAGPDELSILSLVKSEIDVKNIMNVLRGKKEGAKEEQMKRFIIPGGNIAPRTINNLIKCRTIDEIVSKLRSKYNLEQALERYRMDRSLVHFEMAMERKLVEKWLKTLRISTISTGALVDYLYLLEREITNIRKIVRAKEFNLPLEKLKEIVVMVG